jgi:hypothetical protein
MNHADLPGLAVVLPILAIEFWYWEKPFNDRPALAKKMSGILMVALFVFLVFRCFTKWGSVYF